jgi:hypothetical protein
LLAACSSEESTPCNEAPPESLVRHDEGTIVSGRGFIGVTWIETIAKSEGLVHAAMVLADGTRTPDVRVTVDQLAGTAGASTVLWHASAFRTDCEVRRPFEATLLHADGSVHHVDIADGALTDARTVTFDGQRYHAFWTTGGANRYRTLDEDGTLGPIGELPATWKCVRAASDRAGTIFARVGNEGYVFDPTLQAHRLVWSRTMTTYFGQSFYFGGKFHVELTDAVASIDPVAGTAVDRPWLDFNAHDYYPGPNKLFIDTDSAPGVVEIDRNMQRVDEHRPAFGPFGILDDDRVYYESYPNDHETPGRIELVREGETPWVHVIATNSPPTAGECTRE